jgi:hypothetical protein
MKAYRVIPLNDEWAVECREGTQSIFVLRGGFRTAAEALERIRGFAILEEQVEA